MPIHIRVELGGNAATSRVTVSGDDRHPVTEKERKIFPLSNNQLKQYIAKKYEHEPERVYLNNNKLYDKHSLLRCHAKLEPLDGRVVGFATEPVVVNSTTLKNRSSTVTGTFSASVNNTVEQSFQSSWENGQELELGSEIHWGVCDVLGGSFHMELTESHMKGESEVSARTVGNSASVSCSLKPGDGVLASLKASRHVMKVRVRYRVSLEGGVLARFEKRRKTKREVLETHSLLETTTLQGEGPDGEELLNPEGQKYKEKGALVLYCDVPKLLAASAKVADFIIHEDVELKYFSSGSVELQPLDPSPPPPVAGSTHLGTEGSTWDSKRRGGGGEPASDRPSWVKSRRSVGLEKIPEGPVVPPEAELPRRGGEPGEPAEESKPAEECKNVPEDAGEEDPKFEIVVERDEGEGRKPAGSSDEAPADLESRVKDPPPPRESLEEPVGIVIEEGFRASPRAIASRLARGEYPLGGGSCSDMH